MAEVTLNFTAEQIDLRLENAGNAILHTEQTLTPEQQEQARKNIGAEAVMLELTDYGIDVARLLLSGGGAVRYEDVGSFWEDVNATQPGQVLFLTTSLSDATIVPPPATLYYGDSGSGMAVVMILSQLTVSYFDTEGKNNFLASSAGFVPYGASGADIYVAVTSSAKVPQPQ